MYPNGNLEHVRWPPVDKNPISCHGRCSSFLSTRNHSAPCSCLVQVNRRGRLFMHEHFLRRNMNLRCPLPPPPPIFPSPRGSCPQHEMLQRPVEQMPSAYVVSAPVVVDVYQDQRFDILTRKWKAPFMPLDGPEFWSKVRPDFLATFRIVQCCIWSPRYIRFYLECHFAFPLWNSLLLGNVSQSCGPGRVRAMSLESAGQRLHVDWLFRVCCREISSCISHFTPRNMFLCARSPGVPYLQDTAVVPGLCPLSFSL